MKGSNEGEQSGNSTNTKYEYQRDWLRKNKETVLFMLKDSEGEEIGQAGKSQAVRDEKASLRRNKDFILEMLESSDLDGGEAINIKQKDSSSDEEQSKGEDLSSDEEQGKGEDLSSDEEQSKGEDVSSDEEQSKDKEQSSHTDGRSHLDQSSEEDVKLIKERRTFGERGFDI